MSTRQPLAGTRILSLEQFGAGPYGTMFLAQLGAEVIKIENPGVGGDPARYTGPYPLGEADSQYFQSWNLNKRSLTLDIKAESGRAAFLNLVAGADAVVNNLRGDLPSALGLDYPTLSRTKASIVCVHISAYGRDGARAAWPGYDYLMQAESGLMSLTGEPGGPPSRFGAPSLIDHMTGMTAMVGLLAALLEARRSGRGCDVDLNLLDVALHQLGYTAVWYLNEGFRPTRQSHSAHFSVAPAQTFATQDGWIFVMCMTEKFWTALIGAIGRPDLQANPHFASVRARHEHREELTGVLEQELRRQPTRYWLAKFAGVLPAAPVLDVDSALSSDYVAESGMIQSVEHPHKADLRVLSNPLKIDGRRAVAQVCSALGADTSDLLRSSHAAERDP